MKVDMKIASSALYEIMLNGYNSAICGNRDEWQMLCSLASSTEASNFNLTTTILKGIENGKTIEQSFYWRMANSFAQPKPLFSQNGIPTSPVFRANTANGVLVSAYFLHFDGVVIKYGKKAVGLATAHGVNLNYFNHLNLW